MTDSGQSMSLRASLDRGYTLPAEWYSSQAYFEREQRSIFRRCWQYAGLVEHVARPGDFFTLQMGDVPVVVVRDAACEIHAFVNVCRHRGSQLISAERGHCATFQCSYHAWTYKLDGSLHKARGAADEPDFNAAEFSLASVRLETWGPFIFVNLDPAAPPLGTILGELPQLVEGTGLDLGAVKLRVHRTLEIQANWKVVTDNYLECYHCAVAHPAFCDLIDVNNYTVTEYDYFSTQTGFVTESAKKGAGKHQYDASTGVAEGFYVYLWPNFTLNIYPGPGNVSLNLFVPLDANRTLAIYDYCFADAVSDKDAEDFVRFIDRVQDEDTVLCESVQRGLRSGYFQQGKLMLKREKGLQHFQQLVHRFVMEE